MYFESAPEHAFERHRAFNLKVPAGAMVMGMFMVRDVHACDWEVRCSNEGWTAEIADNVLGNLAVQTPCWVGEKATIEVIAIRLSDRKSVHVEFEFETVEGWGESAGCVAV